jgi:hypothetical protein
MMTVFGLRPALIAALGLSYSVLAIRALGKGRTSGIIILGAVLITARTAIAFSTNNAFLYFLQPSLGNFLLASAFLVSVAKSRPLTRTLADDFCSFPKSLSGHDGLHRFFCRLSLLWAVVCAANGVGSLLLLIYGSLGNVLFLRPVISYGLIITGIAISYTWFRRSMGSVGFRIRFGAEPAAA